MKIYLIGYMGAGKSHIGSRLAGITGLSFVDTDQRVEREAGKSIVEIFETEGEASFRERERKALEALTVADQMVIATGGGLPCHADNMELIKRSGISVYLRVSNEIMLNRLAAEGEKRPLISSLSTENLAARIASHLEAREPFYLKADKVVDADRLTAEELSVLLGLTR